MLQKFLSNATCLELRRVGATKKKKKDIVRGPSKCRGSFKQNEST